MVPKSDGYIVTAPEVEVLDRFGERDFSEVGPVCEIPYFNGKGECESNFGKKRSRD